MSCWSISRMPARGTTPISPRRSTSCRPRAATGIPVVVLDRPNPIGGAVQGNVLDTGPHHPGRPARRADAARPDPRRAGAPGPERPRLPVELIVVPAAGWRRSRRSTHRPAVRPAQSRISRPWKASSIIRAPACSRAPTSRSAGESTRRSSRSARPGWTPPRVLAALARAATAQACASKAVSFTPNRAGRRQIRGYALAGIRLTVTDRDRLRPDGDGCPPAGGDPPDPSRAVRLDPQAFRPAGRWAAALRTAIDAGEDPASRCVRGWESGPDRRSISCGAAEPVLSRTSD